MCTVCTGYHGTSEIEHGLCACTVDNPLAKARGLSLRTGAQTVLYLSLGVCMYSAEQFFRSFILIEAAMCMLRDYVLFTKRYMGFN